MRAACLWVRARLLELMFAFRTLCCRLCVVLPFTVNASCAPVLRASPALQGELRVGEVRSEGRGRGRKGKGKGKKEWRERARWGREDRDYDGD